MKILVTNLMDGKPTRTIDTSHKGSVSRVWMFKSGHEFNAAVSDLKLPYYVIDLKEKLEREQFNDLLNKLRVTPVDTILDEEAVKMVKKKCGPNSDIIKMIVQIG